MECFGGASGVTEMTKVVGVLVVDYLNGEATQHRQGRTMYCVCVWLRARGIVDLIFPIVVCAAPWGVTPSPSAPFVRDRMLHVSHVEGE